MGFRAVLQAGMTVVLAAAFVWVAPAAAVAKNDAVGKSAVVVMYHRFGDSRYPTTNIRIEQFEEHLAEIRQGNFTVLPLTEIALAIKEGRTLPDRTLGISIDDAFLSVYEEAWPRLRAEGLPFTLFIATTAVDQGLADYMSWDQIRELADAGVTIGSQTANHPHLPRLDHEAIDRELALANDRFRAELGKVPTLFAYPYGEYGLLVRERVAAAGFTAAFGQHSGVLYPGLDPMTYPRFALNEQYGDLGRFRLVANALPLPATDITPLDPLLGANPPAIGFTLPERLSNLGALSCFASDQGKIEVERLGTRIEARLKSPFPPGRARVNCTMPGPDGRWRWFGRQFYVPSASGAAAASDD